MAVAYEFPRLPLILFAFDFLLARPRPFHRDCRRILAANPYPRCVEGSELVLAEGPFILTMNHYNRRGLRPYHGAMAINAAIAERRPQSPYIAWIITSELVGEHLGSFPIPIAVTRWALARIARVYGFLLMPPPAAGAVVRASVARSALRLVRRHPVGLAPEGGGSGVLRPAPPGAGLFLLSLTASGAPVLPVGLWEEEETLHVRFGEPYTLSLPRSLPRDEQDRLACQQVMTSIGRLLPRTYWGAYEGALLAQG